MSVSEFNNAEFGQTMMFIEERQKIMIQEGKRLNEQHMISRINTFYIMKTFGSKVSSPDELYQLNSDTDEVKNKTKNPFDPELDKIFQKL